jgi:hypothetical protein
MAAASSLDSPRVLAALDFGTSFSGYAWAPVRRIGGSTSPLQATDRCVLVRARPNRAIGFSWKPRAHASAQEYNWEGQSEGGGVPYSKTLTVMLVDDSKEGREAIRIGYPALIAHTTREMPDTSSFHAHFKLDLAPEKLGASEDGGEAVKGLVASYLRELSALALASMRSTSWTAKDMQWCASHRVAD